MVKINYVDKYDPRFPVTEPQVDGRNILPA